MWSKGGWIKVTATTIPIEWLETEPEDPSIKEKLEKIESMLGELMILVTTSNLSSKSKLHIIKSVNDVIRKYVKELDSLEVLDKL